MGFYSSAVHRLYQNKPSKRFSIELPQLSIYFTRLEFDARRENDNFTRIVAVPANLRRIIVPLQK